VSNVIPTSLKLLYVPADSWLQPTHFMLLEDVTVANFLIPSGFVFDGATVPRLLWPIFPPHGRYLIAALLHAYLLSRDDVSDVVADFLFMKTLKVLGIKRWRCWGMYLGVRMGSFVRGLK